MRGGKERKKGGGNGQPRSGCGEEGQEMGRMKEGKWKGLIKVGSFKGAWWGRSAEVGSGVKKGRDRRVDLEVLLNEMWRAGK